MPYLYTSTRTVPALYSTEYTRERVTTRALLKHRYACPPHSACQHLRGALLNGYRLLLCTFVPPTKNK